MTNKASKPLILVDGSSYLYRAFNALPGLNTRTGQPTGAIYGVLSMLKKLITEYQPDHIAVIFDPRGKTTRHALYVDYKAHRPRMPDELQQQVQPLFEVIRAMGLPLIQVEGVEADDVMATLAIQAQKENHATLIATGDKDMAQLVNDHISLIDTMKGVILDSAGVIQKFGVLPERIVDYLALIGDTADNIPGVPKVGPNTAVKWLQAYGSLEGIISHAEDISGKVGESLRSCVADLPQFKQLITLDCDVVLSHTFADLQKQPEDKTTLSNLYQQLEFHTWAKALREENRPKSTVSAEYKTVLTEADFEACLELLSDADKIALEIETVYQSVFDPIIGIALCVAPHQAFYIPLKHNDVTTLPLSKKWILGKLGPLLADSNRIVIGQNLKQTISILAQQGIILEAKLFDIGIASYVLNSAHRHDLSTLARDYLDKSPTSLEAVAGKGAKQLTLDQLDINIATQYVAEKADVLLQLYPLLENLLRVEVERTDAVINTPHPPFGHPLPKGEGILPQQKGEERLGGDLFVFEHIELPLISVLSRMEQYGVGVDTLLLNELSRSFANRMAELEEEAHKQAGQSFNLASPKQLQEILYQKMQLPVLEKTPTGAPSTAESVLQILALDYSLPKILLEHRSLSKLKSTYTDSLPKQVNPNTGRIHTSYNQAVTSTGRLSSTDPNLQNIPIKHEAGRRIRQAFIPADGYKMISADYSQIELRIMAHLSQDPQLLKAFAEGLDVHTATASELFNTSIEKVTSEQRRHAKAINFGLIYGMSAFGLGKQLGIARDLAQTWMDKYFAKYPNVHNYMDQTRALAHKTGYVETLHGRKIYLPDILSTQLQRRNGAERAAINAPMQGTAAEMIKLAMIALDQWIQAQDPVTAPRMIMQVHDELVFEVLEEQVDAVIPVIRDKMAQVVKLSVPLEVTVKGGNNWDEAH